MQKISRFLAVLIALIFLIGPLAGSAAAHETEDGDHEGADYGSLMLTRQDDHGDTLHVGETLQFGVEFTQSDDHAVPGTIDITFMVDGVARTLDPGLTIGGDDRRTFDYQLDATADLGAGALSRSLTLLVQYVYTPADQIEDGGDDHEAQTITSKQILDHSAPDACRCCHAE